VLILVVLIILILFFKSESFRISAVCAFHINKIQKNFHAKKFWGISETGTYHTRSSQVSESI